MITKEEALEALESLDDCARMADIEPIGPYNVLKQFIEEHYQDSLLWKKAKELDLDIGIYHNDGYPDEIWFEQYVVLDIDNLISNETN